jgi:ketosteroid isomerase-like protein
MTQGQPSKSAQNKAAVLAFVEVINAHDVPGIVALLADDYKYVNSSGDHFHGKAFMRDEWASQFQKHPDFRIRVGRIVADDDAVAVFGYSEGTYAPDGVLRAENRWSVPAAFLVMTRGGQITYFESFSDASMVYDLIQATQQQAADAGD